MTTKDTHFMRRAIFLAKVGMETNAGGPFGAVLVKDDEILAEGHNRVTSGNDPTAHAEVVVIREACAKLNTFELTGCTLYTSCEPCPMCLGAVYWARIKYVYFGCTRKDAAAVSFDDQFIYEELAKPPGNRQIAFESILRDEALTVFNSWEQKKDKTNY